MSYLATPSRYPKQPVHLKLCAYMFKQVNEPIVDISGVSESVEPSLVSKDTVGLLQRSTSSVAALREPEHLLYVYVLTF